MSTKTVQDFKKEIVHLVEAFDRDAQAMRTSGYKETTLRLEYLDTFFESLGWDVRNRHGAPLHLREVLVENRTEQPGKQRRVDYTFRINGLEKWVCEAKKPFDHINRHFYQPQYYAYYLRLRFAILFDFENLVIFVVPGKPSGDSPFPPVRRYHYRDYLGSAQKIWDLLSRDAVESGSIEKLIQDLPKIAGKSAKQLWLIKPDRAKTVDVEFLELLERHRQSLAKALIRSNQKVHFVESMLGEATQVILDRILFQRICEDREIETGARLETMLLNWEEGGKIDGQLWPTVLSGFKFMARTFNGGLYGREGAPSHFVDKLLVPDDWLEEFISELTDETSTYLFSTIPVEILGSAYERFLGSIVKPSGQIEQKLDVRKAGGVYYTPRYVVNAVIDQTLSQKLRSATFEEARAIRVLDPACGSGSFLLASFERLCSYYAAYFTHNAAQRSPERCYEHEGDIHLTTFFKRGILLNQVYGVDIDPLAVEVTQLSLYLKVLEGETRQTLVHDLQLFPREKLLPDLSKNIKCGNSLIGSNIYPEYCAEDELKHIRPFPWDQEFPFIKRRKFDVVVGNPPWGATLSQAELKYCREHYGDVVERMVDSYIFFIQKSVELAGKSGFVGLVVPTTLLNQVDARPARRLLLKRGLSLLADLGEGVFGADATNTASIVVSRSMSSGEDVLLKNVSQEAPAIREKVLLKFQQMPFEEWSEIVGSDAHDTFFVTQMNLPKLLQRLQAHHPKLETMILGEIQRGVTPDVVEAHVITKATAKNERLELAICRPAISGQAIIRHGTVKSDEVIIYTDNSTDIRKYPKAKAWLSKFRKHITCPEVRDGKHPWWRLHRPRSPEIFKSPKFIGLTTSKRIELVFDANMDLYVTDAMYVFRPKLGVDPDFLGAVMQSDIFRALYLIGNQGEGRVIPQIKAAKLNSLPVPAFAAQNSIHAKIASDARALASLIAASEDKAGSSLDVAQRQILAIENRIEENIARAYGLKPADIESIRDYLAANVKPRKRQQRLEMV